METKRLPSDSSSRPSIQDACPTVAAAIKVGALDDLKKSWHAHPNLRVSVSSEPVRIASHVLEMLVHQAYSGAQIMIPLYFHQGQDEHGPLISAMWVGPPGTHDSVAFSGRDPYLTQARQSVFLQHGVMPMGHTKPFGYGPIFSHISFNDVRGGEGLVSADYHTARTFEPYNKSPLHLIVALNPETELPMLGVIEAKEGHHAVYHPWVEVRPASPE